MAYASKQGRTLVNSRSPSASGQCDRCGFLYNHSHLRWQMDYSGAGIYNKRILVCERCYDIPQQQLKVIVIPPDPLPVLNARPPDYVDAETNYRYTSVNDSYLILQNMEGAILQQNGGYIYLQGSADLTDPVTGIPIVQGDVRGLYAQINTIGGLSLEDQSGLIALEDSTQNALGLESSSEFALRVTQQTGEPPYGKNELPGTNFQVPGNDDPGLPYENVNVPKTGPLT